MKSSLAQGAAGKGRTAGFALVVNKLGSCVPGNHVPRGIDGAGIFGTL